MVWEGAVSPLTMIFFWICSMKRCCLVHILTTFDTIALYRSTIYPGFWSTRCWLLATEHSWYHQKSISAHYSYGFWGAPYAPQVGSGAEPHPPTIVVPFRLKWKHLVLFNFLLFTNFNYILFVCWLFKTIKFQIIKKILTLLLNTVGSGMEPSH